METETRPVLDNLTGSFLISTPKMPDPRFAEQVIYICAHNEEGAMGVAVNRPNPFLTLEEILSSAHLPIPEYQLPPVYAGGPVEMESAFILYRSDYHAVHKLEVSSTISLSRENRILEDIAHEKGPDKYLFILGYAGWGPGQLESELIADGWLTLPADEHIIFDTLDDDKWKAAALLYGIDISTFDDTLGYA
jgi:putative transcriptional regulator